MKDNDSIPIVKPSLPSFDESFAADVKELVESGILTKGKYVEAFESRVATHLGVKHAITTSSCTIGLLLTYAGLGLKGEVLVPSFTFMATVHPLVWLGVKPVFVDIDAETWNVSVDSIKDSITDNTTAIIAVHTFGNPAPIEELEGLAKLHGIPLIFDAAHGFGSLHKGMPLGSYGDAEVFSLSPTKLLIGGEGGVIATNNDELASYVRLGREYGNPGDYGSLFAGLNARLGEFNALLALRHLDILEKHATHRNRIIDIYKKELDSIPGIATQYVADANRSSYKDFTITVDESLFGKNRDQLSEKLSAKKVDTRKYYYPPVHLHDTYKQIDDDANLNLSNTLKVSSSSLSLPIWSDMDERTVIKICDLIRGFHICND